MPSIMINNLSDIGGVLNGIVFKETSKLAQMVRDNLGESLEELKEEIEENLSKIVFERYYSRRPSSKFYDRTYQFQHCGSVQFSHGGGHYVITLYLDYNKLDPKLPPRKGMLGSYCTIGKDYSIEPLDDDFKAYLVDDWAEQYGILEAFQEWFNREMQPRLFDNIQAKVGKWAAEELY